MCERDGHAWLPGHSKVVDCVEYAHKLADVPWFDRKKRDVNLKSYHQHNSHQQIFKFNIIGLCRFAYYIAIPYHTIPYHTIPTFSLSSKPSVCSVSKSDFEIVCGVHTTFLTNVLTPIVVYVFNCINKLDAIQPRHSYHAIVVRVVNNTLYPECVVPNSRAKLIKWDENATKWLPHLACINIDGLTDAVVR